MKELLTFIESLEIPLIEGWDEYVQAFYEALLEQNKKCNLTRITDFQEYLYKHIADSLLLAKVIPEITEEPMRMLDIGCGGGIPGLPLGITFPNLLITEVDARRKKVECVFEMIQQLGLENIEAIHSNALELSHTAEYGEQIDIVVARAVGHTCKVLQQGRKFLVPKTGIFVAYKTPQQIDEEHDELHRDILKRSIKMKAKKSQIFELPHDMGNRQFWILTQSGRMKR